MRFCLLAFLSSCVYLTRGRESANFAPGAKVMVAAVHTAEAACRDAGAFFSCLLCSLLSAVFCPPVVCCLSSVCLRSGISVEVFWIEKTKCDRFCCCVLGHNNDRREVEPCTPQAGRPAGHRHRSGAIQNGFFAENAHLNPEGLLPCVHLSVSVFVLLS